VATGARVYVTSPGTASIKNDVKIVTRKSTRNSWTTRRNTARTRYLSVSGVARRAVLFVTMS
jgi:hypothetical protein